MERERAPAGDGRPAPGLRPRRRFTAGARRGGPPTAEDFDEIDQLQQALARNARLKRRQEEAEALARERAIAEAEARRAARSRSWTSRARERSRGATSGSASRRLGNRDPEKARIERDNAMLVRHMTDMDGAAAARRGPCTRAATRPRPRFEGRRRRARF